MAYKRNYKLRYLSLFSGIGGFEVGIQDVFPNATCVGYSEIDPYARQVYETQFPDHKWLGSVQKVHGNYHVDLIVGGSPCQNLSSMAQMNDTHLGLDGSKSKLFYEFVRVVRENKGCYFILENVASMTEADEDEITSILSEFKTFDPVMIDSQDFSAQRRKRLFWTNIPNLQSRLDHYNANPTRSERIRDILDSVSIARNYIVDIAKSQTYKTYKKSLKKYGSSMSLTLLSASGEVTPTLRTSSTMWINDDRIKKVRKLTPHEFERLQTFPDGWTDGLSYTRKIRMLGNAVTCRVIEFIVQGLVKK